MKIFAPDYYKDFRCIAGSCQHSCGIGWEIDIDRKTADFYKNVPGNFGKRLCENIDFHEEGGTFRLCENERCPFLNEKGLCDIIINLGESALGQVCDDHPRFRNFYESRTEIGLGLCCEAAAKLILEKQSPFSVCKIEDDSEFTETVPEEESFFAFREKAFRTVLNRNLPMERRIENLLELCETSLPEKTFSEWAEIYLGLERLDKKWTEVLEYMAKNPSPPKISDEVSVEQLLCYYLFRHFSIEEPELSCAFAVLSFYITEKAAEYTGLLESARLYSSEIEYSDENKEKLLDIIYETEV